MLVSNKLLQEIMSYAGIVMGVLTQTLSGIHLPMIASAILGLFGIVLHPLTSVNATATVPSVSHSQPVAAQPVQTAPVQTPVQGL